MNRQRKNGRRTNLLTHLFKVVYLLGELAVVNLSIIISFAIVAASRPLEFELSYQDYLSTIPLLMVLAVVYIDFLGMTQFFRRTYSDVLSSSIIFSFLTILSTSTIAFFFRWFLLSRYVLVIAGFVMIVLSFFWSSLCLKVSKSLYNRGKLLIIATTRTEADLLFRKACYEFKSLHMDYIGYTLDKDPETLFSLIDKSTEVMLSPQLDEKTKSAVMLYCADRDKTIFVVPHFSDLMLTRFKVRQFYDMPTFMLVSLGLTFQQRLIKRIFDILFSLVVLLVTLPLLLLTAILIRIDSPGPAIFSQQRATLDGRIYKVLKFRTMVQDAEERYGAHLSSQDDPRLTRVGKWLRSTRLDEMPQFINILIGDMSVVGPRPERPGLIIKIEDTVPGFTQRLKVKSGLTGMAQIYGRYDTNPEDKLRFDMLYIRNYSFLLDIRIIAQTLKAMMPSSIYRKDRLDDNFAAQPDGCEKESPIVSDQSRRA